MDDEFRSITYSRYNVHLDGGTVLHLQLTSEQAQDLFDLWVNCGDANQITTFAKPRLQGVRLMSISAIAKDNG